MPEADQLLNQLKQDILQSLTYLEYSLKKIANQGLSTKALDPETLETFEALVSRFARTTDIFLAKYLRAVALRDDPAFRGGLHDWVNYAEKKGLIDSAREWMEIRQLRNKISHEYTTKDLATIFEQVLRASPIVLKIGKSLP